eukprot:TRINITY_DN14008_c0_g2_i2.p1 TRINITY_DN14008_c0_g2~~TRINITY_DN14008_c0_g2_i2.p1  ORF type:complete len:239 (-),score=39.98 TRINITY_DN14008_c0_g2_i2:105-821(-)
MNLKENQNEEPLDTSLALRDKFYNFYTMKKIGLYKMKSRKLEPIKEKNLVMQRKNQSFLVKIRSATKSPSKQRSGDTRNRTFAAYSHHSIQTLCSHSRKKEQKHILLKHPFHKKRAIQMEQQLFNEIKDYDENSQTAYKVENRLMHYTSEGIQGFVTWGMKDKRSVEKLNVFGRKPIHKKVKTGMQEHDIESLMKLVDGDIRLYIPSKYNYKKIHEKAVIQLLLAQSNSGVKYRNPNN